MPSNNTNTTNIPLAEANDLNSLIVGIVGGVGGLAAIAALGYCYIQKCRATAASKKESQGEDQPLASSQAPDSLELSNLSVSAQGRIHSPSLPSIAELPMTPQTIFQPDLQTKVEKEEESSSLPSTKQVSTTTPWILDSLSAPSSQSLITWPLSKQESLKEDVPRETKVSISRPASPSSPRLMGEDGKVEISFNIAFEDLEFDEKNKLGTGAYGTVYKGAYKFDEVAIKKLHAEHFSEEALAEFKQEASIMAAMRSDYIVLLRGVCLQAPNFCMVMELMPKGSLYGLLQNSPELSLLVLYRIALDIGYGLYRLHEAGILHRDLKSLNVLLDDRLRAKLTDFGLSKIKSEMASTSSSQGMKGTLGWMAPELFDEKPKASQASDIYSYGMILWELVNRPYRIPFKGLAPASLITAKLKRGENQETLPEKCPPKYADLIRWCWQTPQQRPSAKQAAEGLRPLWEETSKTPAP